MSKNKESHPIEYWVNETKLPNNLSTTLKFQEKLNYTFLLTGSTGYLGAFNLKDLILNEKCQRVYCVVRSYQSFDHCKQMLKDSIHKTTAQPFGDQHLDKIYPVKGDLTKFQLGLSSLEYEMISDQVDIIISVAAQVNFSSPYKKSKITNVDCVPRLLELAVSNKKSLKRIVHVSTMAVFFDDKEIIENDNDLPLLEKLNGKSGYFQSKAIAEYRYKEASNNGFEILLIRSPGLFCNGENGYGNNSDLFQLGIKTCLIEGKTGDCKYIPNFNTAPVDWFSRVMIKMTIDKNVWIEPFNAFNPSDSTYFREYMQMVGNEFSLPELPMEEWLEFVKNSNHPTTQITLSIIKYLGYTLTKFNAPMSIKTKDYLKSINEYDGHKITRTMVFKYIYASFFFKSKL
ncbi:hypothetical protein CYY_002894 [Polysphondylium violaceum]|uniref:Thioester reductase (TE) domain-containing protein n=1 Tax=Polysphondylium violaceum TaxID=133409 RepID=A0A8J4UUR7_9MYCE|nr:hypothetical protein CYY_002894 [Polysphondylium violaceum]